MKRILKTFQQRNSPIKENFQKLHCWQTFNFEKKKFRYVKENFSFAALINHLNNRVSIQFSLFLSIFIKNSEENAKLKNFEEPLLNLFSSALFLFVKFYFSSFVAVLLLLHFFFLIFLFNILFRQINSEQNHNVKVNRVSCV